MREPTVFIEPGLFPPAKAGLIEDVLRQIDWGDPIDSIRVTRRFDDGRSGADVAEVELSSDGRRQKVVVKVGPDEELRIEYEAIGKLKHPPRLFMPVRTGSPSVIRKNAVRYGDAAGLVYEHADRFLQGISTNYEQIARTAIFEGGNALATALNVLDDLVSGLEQVYQQREYVTGTNWELWNEWLGPDAAVEVDSWNNQTNGFSHSEFASQSMDGLVKSSDKLREAVCDPDSKRVGAAFEMNVTPEWWQNKLFLRPPHSSLLVEVVCDESVLETFKTRRSKKAFKVRGVIRRLRAQDLKNRLASQLEGVVKIENGVISETNPTEIATIAVDPFSTLPKVLNRDAKRLTTLAHGDLHGGNIVVVQTKSGNTLAGVIDYRWLKEGRPWFFDFVKLEVTLMRNALVLLGENKQFSWPEAIRLQRLLAVATRLGRDSNEAIRRLLFRSDDRRLANAFALIIAIRNHAREIHPRGDSGDWHLAYAENLFLAAYSTFKWPNKTRWENIASLAIAAVAAEWLDPSERYRRWDKKELADTVKKLTLALAASADINEISAVCCAIDERDWRLPAVEASLATAVRAHLEKSYRQEINELSSLRASEYSFYMSIPAELMAIKGRLEGGRKRDVLEILREHKALVVLGDLGSGKTTMAQVWQYEMANALREKKSQRCYFPLVIWAPFATKIPREINEETCVQILTEATQSQIDVSGQVSLGKKLKSDSSDLRALLVAGALHITIDALNEVEDSRKGDIVRWIVSLRACFPRCPVVVCHRLYNYSPGLLPFPVVELQKVEYNEIKRYIRNRFWEKNSDAGEALIKLLFPEKKLAHADRLKVDDLIQTPFLLKMIVDETCSDEVLDLDSFLSGRGKLFSRFADLWLSGKTQQTVGARREYHYSLDDKLKFLILLGDFLVSAKTRIISPSDMRELGARSGLPNWSEILDEIVDAGMLLRPPDGYLFRYQSFEEFFAAQRFFADKTDASELLAARVRAYVWHDTLVMLVAYGDLNQPRLDELVRLSRIVDPVLTARILRMAEHKDWRLYNEFIDGEMEVLRTPDAGQHQWTKAVEAIAVLGSERSANCLFEIARDQKAPAEARAAALRRLVMYSEAFE